MLGVFSVSANAMLIDRGGGFIYDTDQNITWTQDANLNGLGIWSTQMSWVAGLSLFDSVRNVTWSDWRLPTTSQPDASCGTQTDPGGGFPLQGSGYGCTGSEMGHLFNVDGINSTTAGPFTNVAANFYWSSTAYAPSNIIEQRKWAQHFGQSTGFQAANTTHLGNQAHAWAVRDGDVGPVPIPAAVWLFGSALGLLGWIRRKKA